MTQYLINVFLLDMQLSASKNVIKLTDYSKKVNAFYDSTSWSERYKIQLNDNM